MNLLIVSPGRRVELVHYFKKEIHKTGGRVFTADMSEYAPALYSGDEYFVVEKDFSNLDKYIDKLIDICKKYKIENLITFIDPELKLFAENRKKFEDEKIKLILSDESIIEDTFDKFKFYTKYKDKLNLVNTYGSYESVTKAIEDNELSFPIFCKDRYGSGSSGINKIQSMEELISYENNKELIFQKYIKGNEYGVDVYIDSLSKKITSVFMKRKIGMRAGETDKSISLFSKDILNEIMKIEDITGLRGPIDVDVFVGDHGQIFINEINPRFGGGYPHAYNCGVDFIKMIVNNLNNIENIKSIGEYKENVVMMKYNGLVFK